MHVVPGEAPVEALVRELAEELGVVVTDLSPEPLAQLALPDVAMSVWCVRTWTGTPSNLQPEEHDALGWFGLEALAGLRLADEAYPALLAELLLSVGG